MTPTLPSGMLPLVGRAHEVGELRSAMDAAAQGAGSSWLVTGSGGVGKTRLGRVLIEEAERRDWWIASGRSFPVEAGVPYALFADALLPIVRRMDEQALVVLTRGVGELTQIFPWLGGQSTARTAVDPQSPDFRSRLHWHFTEFIRGLVAKHPMLIVLEDLQWADTSSLELLHFVARHMVDAQLLLYCTWNPDQRTPAPALRSLEQTVRGLPRSRLLQLEPLDLTAVEELVCRAFAADATVTRTFSTLLFGWTRGNPFFIEETLKLFVAAGDLREEGGRWVGWEVEALRLPPSVREAVISRLETLSPAAREVAELAAVFGARIRLHAAAAVLRSDAHAVLGALDELRAAHVLDESDVGDDVTYEFAHPLVRETLYESLSRARARLLHAAVATTLEQHYGDAALDHADELAFHFARSGAAEARDKTVRYLGEAGRRALAKYANREAADYLAAALERVPDVGSEAALSLAAMLAKARQRLGEYVDALALWQRVREAALRSGDAARAAGVARRMGLACYWSGDVDAALRHFDEGLADALRAEDARLVVRLRTAKAACLQEVGQPQDALIVAQDALRAAEHIAEPALHARVHRTFLQLHLWLGDADLAHHHGTRALELAEESGDRPLAFMAHWAMGVLNAFRGDSAAVERHLQACYGIAEDLRAPVLRVWADELAVEFASARGDWDRALQIGEEAIRMARALQQRALLPRLLVWTALIHLARGDLERSAGFVDEAWELAGASASGARVNVHAVLPAYIGRTALALARGDYDEAVSIGEAGVAIADRTGYPLWAVHRLLPMVAEAHLWMRDLDGARRIGARLRRDAARLRHRLAEGWANACDALVAWLGGDSEQGAVLLRSAAEQLEALPYMLDATRLRRQLAGRLAEIGQRDAALRELRLVHDRLLQLGAEQELRKARQQFREIGTRPPPLGRAGRSGAVLTERELLIAELAAEHRSSKAIARELDISVRTVDAHLNNIYRKLGIASRAELTDLVRAGAVGAE